MDGPLFAQEKSNSVGVTGCVYANISA